MDVHTADFVSVELPPPWALTNRDCCLWRSKMISHEELWQPIEKKKFHIKNLWKKIERKISPKELWEQIERKTLHKELLKQIERKISHKELWRKNEKKK